MSLALLLTLIGIAALDSLNPSLFLAQFYLITTTRPLPRILSYIGGVVLVNVGGGVLFLAGVWGLVRQWIDLLHTELLYGIELALGCALVVFGLLARADPPPRGAARTPRTLQPWHTFVLGAAVMLNELTTALPYVFAIDRITQAQLGFWGNLGALLLYNLVFALPLLGFLGLLMTFGGRFTSQLDRINRGIEVWLPRLIKYGTFALGAALMLDASSWIVRSLA